jgi:hypothetical protein
MPVIKPAAGGEEGKAASSSLASAVGSLMAETQPRAQLWQGTYVMTQTPLKSSTRPRVSSLSLHSLTLSFPYRQCPHHSSSSHPCVADARYSFPHLIIGIINIRYVTLYRCYSNTHDIHHPHHGINHLTELLSFLFVYFHGKQFMYTLLSRIGTTSSA